MRSRRAADVHSRGSGFALRIPLLLAIACFPLPAQPPAPPAAAPIPADSPLLYRLFFGFQLDFDQWLAARKTAAPASASALDAGAANLFGVQAAELSVLASVSRGVAAEVEKIAREEAAYLNLVLSREERPDPGVMNRFRTRREEAAAAGTAALQRSLPSGSYAGLREFINGRFRAAHRIAGDQ